MILFVCSNSLTQLTSNSIALIVSITCVNMLIFSPFLSFQLYAVCLLLLDGAVFIQAHYSIKLKCALNCFTKFYIKQNEEES